MEAGQTARVGSVRLCADVGGFGGRSTASTQHFSADDDAGGAAIFAEAAAGGGGKQFREASEGDVESGGGHDGVGAQRGEGPAGDRLRQRVEEHGEWGLQVGELNSDF